MKSRVQDAVELFMAGYNCCQSVFAAYSDLFGMDREQALKLSCSFGAGMGRMREVCGAVSGMNLIAGLACGNADPEDQAAKTRNYETVRRMADAFRAEHQTIICREILGLRAAEKSAAPSLRTEDYYKSRPCARMVATAARIIEETFPELLAEKTEQFAIYDEDGTRIGVRSREEAHRLGLWHEVVHCWMYCRSGDNIWLYFQQRAHSKKDFPDYYDLASTGHVDAGESHEEAVYREVREETGVRMEAENLTYLGTVREEICEGDFFDREIGHVYLYRLDVPFFAPGEEVDRMVAVSREEYEKKELGKAAYIQGFTLEGEPVIIKEEDWCRHEGEYEQLVKRFLTKTDSVL